MISRWKERSRCVFPRNGGGRIRKDTSLASVRSEEECRCAISHGAMLCIVNVTWPLVSSKLELNT